MRGFLSLLSAPLFLRKSARKKLGVTKEAAHHPTSLVREEHWLLFLLIAAKILLFLRRYNMIVGFDAGYHIEMLNILTWRNVLIDIHQSFYAYHPPFAFLLARTFRLIGFPEVASVQIVSFAASLAAFLLLRATLKRLRLLGNLKGIAFLYISSSLPIQLYLQTSVNIDVVVLALSMLTLYCSARLFWGHEVHEIRTKIWLFSLLSLSLFLGLMTKFSGLLLFCIPFLVVLFSPRHPAGIAKRLFHVCIAAVIAASIAFPYYYVRYYRSEHAFFPNNGEWMVGGGLTEARTKRDSDKVKFFSTFLLSNPIWPTRFERRDDTTLRLWIAWWDFWLPVFPDNTTRGIGFMYFYASYFFCPLGFLAFLFRNRSSSPWYRFGLFAVSYCLFFLLAYIAYLYQNPFTGWGPVKGIYLAPAFSLGIGYLLTEAFSLWPLSVVQRWNLARLPFFLLALFLLINATFPIYVTG